MNERRLALLKVALRLGGLYYIVGAAAHGFGLTIFPFYDGRLYSPYHDTLIALSAIIFSLVLFTIAHDPIKNVALLNVIIVACIVAVIVTIIMVWKIDFTALGAPAKHLQAIVEAILLAIYALVLALLRPKIGT